VDFCSIKKKLVIELDGGQHIDQQEYDDERTKFLQSQGYKVLRLWNDDVLNNLNAVLTVIIEELG